MSDTNEHDPDFHDGFVGISRAELEAMAESELAQWQANHKDEPPLVILAEREWQRRTISHQLAVQYDLDSRLAKAAEEHTNKVAESDRAHAEILAKSNHWWSLWVGVIGLAGTVLGAGLGALWQAKSDAPSSAPSIAVSCHCQDMHQQAPTSPNGAASSAVSSANQSTKKTP